MTHRTLATTAVLALVFVGGVHAAGHTGLRMVGAQARHWQWAKEAQQHVPLPDMRITVENGYPEFFPIAWNPRQHVNILAVRFSNIPGNTPSRIEVDTLHERGYFLHELGHAYDFADMTVERRAAFEKIAETKCGWWDRKCVTVRTVWQPVMPPGEMFAEEYAACALGLTQRQYQDTGYMSYGWIPPQDNPDADAQMCALIRHG